MNLVELKIEKGMITRFEDLEAWNKARELCKFINALQRPKILLMMKHETGTCNF